MVAILVINNLANLIILKSIVKLTQESYLLCVLLVKKDFVDPAVLNHISELAINYVF